MFDLDKRERNVLYMNAFFMLGSSMSGVFISVFVYNYTKSLEATVLYAICRYLTLPIFSMIGGKMSTKYPIHRILATGLILIVSSLIMLLVIREDIPTMVWKAYLVGLSYGGGEGLFWFSMNILNQNVARPNLRSLFVGTMGVLNSLANIVAPIATSLILSTTKSELEGYIQIFIVVIVIYFFVFIQALKLKFDYHTPSFDVIGLLKRQSPKWRFQLKVSFFNSIREGFVLALSGILLYEAFNGSGKTLSYYNTIVSIVSIIAYRIVVTKLPYEKYKEAYFVGNIMIIIGMLSLSFFSLPGAIVFGLFNTVGTPLFTNPFQVFKMKILAEESENLNVTGQIICLEIVMNIARILGLLCLVLLSYVFKSPYYVELGTIAMVMGPCMVFILSRKAMNQFELF